MPLRSFALGILANAFALAIAAAPASISVGAETLSRGKAHKIRAAILFHLANLSNWPKTAFAKPDSDFVIVLAGDDRNDVEEFLRAGLSKRSILGRKVLLKSIEDIVSTPGSEPEACHLLYVIGHATDEEFERYRQLAGPCALTVGELPRFTDHGGMVCIAFEAGKPDIRVNLAAVHSGEIDISSEFLRHSRIINAQEALP